MTASAGNIAPSPSRLWNATAMDAASARRVSIANATSLAATAGVTAVASAGPTVHRSVTSEASFEENE